MKKVLDKFVKDIFYVEMNFKCPEERIIFIGSRFLLILTMKRWWVESFALRDSWAVKDELAKKFCKKKLEIPKSVEVGLFLGHFLWTKYRKQKVTDFRCQILFFTALLAVLK